MDLTLIKISYTSKLLQNFTYLETDIEIFSSFCDCYFSVINSQMKKTLKAELENS